MVARIEGLEAENARLTQLSLENVVTIRELREDKGLLKRHFKAQARRIPKIEKKLERKRRLLAKERRFTKEETACKKRVMRERDGMKTE